ncbi:hypothetical protein TREPR_0103 [Treponema primitia ZAS-2]|uniref:Uncharacterized protein n=1 Tax=Treponema primitia (strain ATCC BAA-887 / DSM 12427 / ZAS-2) TaxID=545694 RepID=F5YN99_TREPZ|nr:hypothetical protein TREPR_0103 [Treponema primitia ZAS-2]
MAVFGNSFLKGDSHLLGLPKGLKFILFFVNSSLTVHKTVLT